MVVDHDIGIQSECNHEKHGYGQVLEPKRMKAVRFSFIYQPGRVIKRSRSLIIRLTKNNPWFEALGNK
jgi:hypothetical protein